jgi:stage II sporulation protein D
LRHWAQGGQLRFARRTAGQARAVVALLAVAAGWAGSCRSAAHVPPTVLPSPAASVEAPPTPTPAPSVALEAVAPEPRLRVGLSGNDGQRASVGAVGGSVVVHAGGRRRLLPRATFVPVSTAVAAQRFRVQVASLADEAAAQVVAGQAARVTSLTPFVKWNPQSRTYQVRLGDVPTRERGMEVVAQLNRAGLAGGWVVPEPAQLSGGRFRLVESGEELDAASVLPEDPALALTLGSDSYRGALEVLANDEGGVTVVNVVNLEDYLRGVVPNELSPSAFPAKEALKAQAVAARTYALRNLGLYRGKGYDICDTPACQVYRGKGTETPLSDEAVAETRGVVATWRGSLINALYTSTCGGHTEDGSNIFEGEPTPYLKGVACLPERSAYATLKSRAGGTPLPADAAFLVALGVIESDVGTASLSAPARAGDVRAWVARLLGALHREPCAVGTEPVNVARRASFFRFLVDAFCWTDRERLLAPGDVDYLLQLEDKAAFADDAERRAAALLVQEGLLSPNPDNTLRPNDTLTRLQAVDVLARLAARAGAPQIMSAEFREMTPTGQLTLRALEGDHTYPVVPWARLFRALDGSRLAASELTLAAGDKVRAVVRDNQIVYLEGEQSRLGPAADRSSRYYRWEVRMTPAELAEKISRYGTVGTVQDVVPRRLGVSGRVVELSVMGSEGEMPLKGLRVRWALGLRENLFVVDRERDARGQVTRFVFNGKGWGHGVGLCQVGAFGMAQAGATYEAILRHYYRGIVVGPRELSVARALGRRAGAPPADH